MTEDRLARYSDEEIAATIQEIEIIEKFGMSAFEKRIADDIRAEHARRLQTQPFREITMGPPDRFEVRLSWDFWVLPGGLTLAIRPRFYSSIGFAIGPLQMALNWGPYMRECEQ